MHFILDKIDDKNKKEVKVFPAQSALSDCSQKELRPDISVPDYWNYTFRASHLEAESSQKSLESSYDHYNPREPPKASRIYPFEQEDYEFRL